MSEKATKKRKQFAVSRDGQRYRIIRYHAEMQGLTIRDLHKLFCRACAKSGRKACHFTVFYRVCYGSCASRRIRTWIAARLQIPFKELWAS